MILYILKGAEQVKILLHACCAPCSIKCIDVLKKNNFEITAFWYNPNIHPCVEYKSRKNTLIDYCYKQNIEVIVKDNYGLREFICNIYPDFGLSRCKICYKKRIEEAAKHASELGYDSFSTTLLISPYQNHNMLIEICEEMSEKYSVGFTYIDFRPYFREGQKLARDMGLYMQKYCGCIFSEEERYTLKNSLNKN